MRGELDELSTFQLAFVPLVQAVSKRSKPYRNRTLTAENASMLRRYSDHFWSAAGSTPIAL